jgi:hypothetical protein
MTLSISIVLKYYLPEKFVMPDLPDLKVCTSFFDNDLVGKELFFSLGGCMDFERRHFIIIVYFTQYEFNYPG